MGRAIRRIQSLLDVLKDRLSERLGNALYHLYVQEHDPFASSEVVENSEPK